MIAGIEPAPASSKAGALTAELNHLEPAETCTTGGGLPFCGRLCHTPHGFLRADTHRIFASTALSLPRPGGSADRPRLLGPRTASTTRSHSRVVGWFVVEVSTTWYSSPTRLPLGERRTASVPTNPTSTVRSGREAEAALPRWAGLSGWTPRDRGAGGCRKHTPFTPVARRHPFGEPPDWLGLRGRSERVRGFEPLPPAWKAVVLSVEHHTRMRLGRCDPPQGRSR